jgi:hypothetical protein
MKKIYIFLLLTVFLSACYDDKGNYDYHDINELTISGIEKSYSCMTDMDVLHIEPNIKMTEAVGESDDLRFEYYWIAMRGSTPIDTIGRERILDYFVALPPDSYTLTFRILDKETGIFWKTSASMTVGNPYTKGIMLMGENDDGNATFEMISMVRDTVIIPDLLANSGLPSLNGPIAVQHTGYHSNTAYIKLWVLTASGGYFLDRLTLKSSEANTFEHLTYTTDNIPGKSTPVAIAPQIRDAAGNTGSTYARAVVCSNGMIFTTYLSLNGGDFYPNPVNRDANDMGTLLKAAPYLMYPINNMGAMIWYDTNNQRFMNYSSFILNVSSVTLTDNQTDPFPWNQGSSGRTMVYAENTRNTDGGSANGNSFALMKNDGGEYFIYKFYINGASPAKRGFYQIKSIAIDFDKADFYAFSSNRTVVFYAVGNKLYAYDYNPNNEKFYQFPSIGMDDITMLKFDTQIDYQINSLYIATYNSSTKGTLQRYIVGNDPDVVELSPVDKAKWNGLSKIKNMNWRAAL